MSMKDRKKRIVQRWRGRQRKIKFLERGFESRVSGEQRKKEGKIGRLKRQKFYKQTR